MEKENEIIPVTRPAVPQRADKPPVFKVAIKKTRNPHKAQCFLNYGNEPGPWLSVGINESVYSFGYLPKKGRKR
jgi:hypothetical protein